MIKLNKLIQGTVFFIDMRNFTFLCSKMSGNPQEDRMVNKTQTQYEARLNFLITQMQHFYHEWSNILKKYIEKENIRQVIFQSTGDGIMIALEGKLHYLAAFEATIEMAKRMRKKLDTQINRRLEELGIKRWSDWLDFGIGICSGSFKYVKVPHTIGEIHSKRNKNIQVNKSSYVTILGTAPNYASRVETASKDHWHSYIMIAESTIELLCKHYNIDMNDVRKIEDVLKVKYLWKHRFKGVKELGLYMCNIE